MTEEMARLILDAKLKELDAKLAAKSIRLVYTDNAKAEMLRLGYSPEYGAREMDRVIGNQINPLIVNEILFGSLANGGDATLNFHEGAFALTVDHAGNNISLGGCLKSLFTKP